MARNGSLDSEDEIAGLVTAVPKLVSIFKILAVDAGLTPGDLKPRDVLVRHLGDGQWDVRITDIEGVAPMPVRLQGKDVLDGCFVDTQLHPACRLLLTMQVTVAVLACGPDRQTGFAQEFVRRALHELALPLGAAQNLCRHPCYSPARFSGRLFKDNDQKHSAIALIRATHDANGICPANMTWDHGYIG